LRNAFAETLVGHVQEGHQAAGLDGVDHLLPLRRREVVARGVVAAGVQHHHGTGGRRVQRGQHAGHVDAPCSGVVVGVGLHREARVGEQRAVVFPGGVADQHLGAGVQALEKVGADLQAAGAAQGLHGGHPAAGHQGLAGFALAAEHQVLHGLVVGRDPVDRQVALGFGLLNQRLLSRCHALQQGQLAVFVVVHTHPQIDLGGVGVGVELFIEAQNGIAGCHFDGGKKRHGSSCAEIQANPSL